METNVRMTQARMLVLNTLLLHLNEGLSGAQIGKETALMSGTLYPILHKLTKLGWLEVEKENVDPKEVGRPRQTFYRLKGQAQYIARQALMKRGYYDSEPFEEGLANVFS